MITFAFWNLNRQPVQQLVSCLARTRNVDVLMLAECGLAPLEMLKALNDGGRAEYHYAPGGCRKIEIFSRFEPQFVPPLYDEERITLRHLRPPQLTDILLAVSHFPSKFHWDNESQSLEAAMLADTIRRQEAEARHSRTVVVGDLNMNPFESGLVGAKGLHAVMTRTIAQEEGRTVQERRYPFFYNPMWSLMGDASKGPPGTYYYRTSQHVTYFWNMFDQVLIRPSLLDRFSNETLEIVERIGDHSLLSPDSRVPDKTRASDHLPIFFGLEL